MAISSRSTSGAKTIAARLGAPSSDATARPWNATTRHSFTKAATRTHNGESSTTKSSSSSGTRRSSSSASSSSSPAGGAPDSKSSSSAARSRGSATQATTFSSRKASMHQIGSMTTLHGTSRSRPSILSAASTGKYANRKPTAAASATRIRHRHRSPTFDTLIITASGETEAGFSFIFSPSSPSASYTRRRFGSLSVSYASFTRWNCAASASLASSPRCARLSGCSRRLNDR
mmetsp:Transcript_14662/g.46102  ORF Transcript_14662/g.46102 Transcript_14662/m.46102 type:complete len:232 (+) Transcript_14662:1205-1900(+)